MNSQSASTSSYLIIFLSFFLLLSSTSAFNITKLLKFYDPEYSIFNDYLTKTHLAGEINRRQTITVLAVANSAMSKLTNKPMSVIEQVMSLHVILDYYDVAKLDKLSKKTALLTTLFQSSGVADNNIGFLNVTIGSGQIQFGSAAKGSPLTANLLKEVATQPYNISVLQISTVIIPSVLDNSPPSKTPAHAPSVAPSPSKSKVAPVASPPKKAAKPPAPTPAPVSDAPTADAPTADAPSDDSPVSSPPSPGPAGGPGPSADGPVADSPGSEADAAPAPKKSSSSKMNFGMSIGVLLMVVVSSWVAL